MRVLSAVVVVDVHHVRRGDQAGDRRFRWKCGGECGRVRCPVPTRSRDRFQHRDEFRDVGHPASRERRREACSRRTEPPRFRGWRSRRVLPSSTSCRRRALSIDRHGQSSRVNHQKRAAGRIEPVDASLDVIIDARAWRDQRGQIDPRWAQSTGRPNSHGRCGWRSLPRSSGRGEFWGSGKPPIGQDFEDGRVQSAGDRQVDLEIVVLKAVDDHCSESALRRGSV